MERLDATAGFVSTSKSSLQRSAFTQNFAQCFQSQGFPRIYPEFQIAMPAGVIPTSDQIRSWNSDELKAEFVTLQTDKSRRSIKEEGRLTVDQLFDYLKSVLDRVEVLQNTPAFSPR